MVRVGLAARGSSGRDLAPDWPEPRGKGGIFSAVGGDPLVREEASGDGDARPAPFCGCGGIRFQLKGCGARKAGHLFRTASRPRR